MYQEKGKKRKYARELYRNMFEEEKENKRQYGHKQYKKFLEDERQVSSVYK